MLNQSRIDKERASDITVGGARGETANYDNGKVIEHSARLPSSGTFAQTDRTPPSSTANISGVIASLSDASNEEKNEDHE